MNLKKTLALGGAVLALGFGGMALAQQPPMGPPPGGHEGMHHPDPAAMAAKHADKLRVALQLRPDQEPALKALVAAMAPPAGKGMGHMGGMGEAHEKMAAMTTPERLDAMRSKMAEHQARFEQHAAAVKKFYAQLTPSQQKAFDAMSLKMGGRMGHGGGREGHGPGGRPPMGGHHGE